jgi:hypothetical protein
MYIHAYILSVILCISTRPSISLFTPLSLPLPLSFFLSLSLPLFHNCCPPLLLSFSSHAAGFKPCLTNLSLSFFIANTHTCTSLPLSQATCFPCFMVHNIATLCTYLTTYTYPNVCAYLLSGLGFQTG